MKYKIMAKKENVSYWLDNKYHPSPIEAEEAMEAFIHDHMIVQPVKGYTMKQYEKEYNHIINMHNFKIIELMDNEQ
jgi:hypothetical protein